MEGINAEGRRKLSPLYEAMPLVINKGATIRWTGDHLPK